MSGSSSSGRSYSGERSFGGLGTPSIMDCSNLQGSTKVISPTMIYFAKASIGSKLKIELKDEIVSLLDSSDNAVGGINPTWITLLIDCLKKGNNYEATINDINGAAIDVYIQPIH
ncbi:hypothetical protein [Sulfuricurvum sp.]|uniref:hypothetical protein n=1 Tax=Sulfuricurvum sp. TaxID=2025608 RepID=UPI00286D9640|nr:hypothetical protein [Sulfuricurvum sp.]